MSYRLKIEVRGANTDRPEYELLDATPAFGVGRSAEWRVDGPGVADVHAYLHFDGATLFVAAAAGQLVTMGGQSLSSDWTPCEVPTKIQLGGVTLSVKAPPSRRELMVRELRAQQAAAKAAPKGPDTEATSHIGPQGPTYEAHDPEEDLRTVVAANVSETLAALAAGSAPAATRPKPPAPHRESERTQELDDPAPGRPRPPAVVAPAAEEASATRYKPVEPHLVPVQGASAFASTDSALVTSAPRPEAVLQGAPGRQGDAPAVGVIVQGLPPPGMQPPGMQPPGMQPPGMQPPGMQPPGMQPPGMPPPGMMPPGMIPGLPPPGMAMPSMTMGQPGMMPPPDGLGAPGQMAPSHLAFGQMGQMASGQMASGQMAPGQMAPGQMASGQMASGQMAPGQMAPGQMAPGQMAQMAHGAPGATTTATPSVIAKIVEQWNQASVAQKGILVMMPFAFYAVFVVFAEPKAVDTDEPETDRTVASAATSASVAASAVAPNPTAPASGASAVSTASSALPTAPTTAPAAAPTPSAVPLAAPPLAKLAPGEKTLEREAVDAFADGRYDVALQKYEALAKQEPGNPAFSAAVAFLRSRSPQK